MVIDVFLYIIFVFLIPSYETLRCYSCTDEEDCSPMMNIIDGDDRNDACMIMVNEHGIIRRGIISIINCQSSPLEYCCYKDFCNGLTFIPLPVLTNLSCMVSTCQIDDEQCNHSIIYRSSPMESCTRIRHGKRVEKSHQIGCDLLNQSKFDNFSCCHSPACNVQDHPSGITIRCYTCDSRIHGLEGCEIFNRSNLHAYQSKSSSQSESCAMIVGLAGIDEQTGKHYPPFVIRTFVTNCVNQSLGNVTFAGARFHGYIQCCSTSLCNTIPLYTKISNQSRSLNLIVFFVFVCLGGIFIFIGMFLSIYRYRSFRKHVLSTDHYRTVARFA